MDEVGLAGLAGYVLIFFWTYFFCGNKDSLNRYTRSNRQYLPTYRKHRLVAHTLDPPLPSLSCPVSSLLSHSLAISPNPSLSLPMHVGSFQVLFET